MNYVFVLFDDAIVVPASSTSGVHFVCRASGLSSVSGTDGNRLVPTDFSCSLVLGALS